MRFMVRLLVGLFLVVSPAIAADGKLERLEEVAFKQAVALADPSVVRIETVGGLEQVDNHLLGNGPTSGVVVSSNGFIISSSFNFIAKPTSVLVTLPDGRRLAAKQIANDRLRQLTLLKVDVEGLIPSRPVTRDQIKVGQWALALGRTLDNSIPSLSVGIVSAVNRVWGKAIQTDAKTSPVNYGGALIDVEGRVLGVIAPLSPSSSEETADVEYYDGGIGFAIPMDDVYQSLERLKQGTDLLPGLMGITFAGGQSLNVPPIVDRVRFNSPAQQAGLKTNDRITEADGEKVVRVAQLKHIVGRKYAGDSLKLIISRGEQSLPIDVLLVGQLIPYEVPFLGILPLRGSSAVPEAGAGTRFVFDNSPAKKAGLERGDRIVKFNETTVKDAATLTDLVGRGRPGDRASMTFVRESKEISAEVVLGSLPEEIVRELASELIRSPEKANTDDAAADAQQPVAEADAKKEKVKTGRFTENLEGRDHDYWAYVPESYEGSHAYGLVVWVHPAGDTMEATLFKQWKSVCDRRGLILVGPKAEKTSGWQPGESEFIKSLIDHVRATYSVDGSRIIMHSHGTGAGMAWHFSMKHREIVRGVVVTGAPFLGQPPDNEPEFRQQFLFVCGETDKNLPKVKVSVTGLRKLKFPVTFRLISGLAAKYPGDEVIDEIGHWVDSLDRI